MHTGTVVWALRWAQEWGVRVLPLKPDTKIARDKGWTKTASNDPARIIELFAGRNDYNIGILCDDLMVVDCDNKHGIDGLANFKALDAMPMAAFETLLLRTPNGYHYIYRNQTGKPLTGKVAGLGPGIDCRSYHNYIVAPGSMVNKKVYSVVDNVPMLDCPEFIVKAMTPDHRKLRDRDGGTEYEDEPTIEACKLFLADRAGAKQGEGGDHWTFATACWMRDQGVSEATAFEMMSELWNYKCEPPWDEEELARKVENAYSYAKGSQGGSHPLTIYAGVKWMPENESDPRWTWHGDDWNTDHQWLFYEMLPAKGVALLTGPPGSGKSFLSTFLAERLATGAPFFGTEPDQRGGTIILAAEAYGGLAARLAALGQNRLDPTPLPIGGTAVGNLNDRAAWQQMRSDLRAACNKVEAEFDGPVRCVILDTLSASGLIEDENDNSQCAKAMKKLGDLAEEFNVLVIVLHHPTKAGSGIRGGSALLGSADYAMQIELPPGKPFKKLLLEKARDATAPRGLGTFTLKRFELGADSRGRPITTAFVVDNASALARDIAPAFYDNFKKAMSFMRSEGYEIGEPIPLDKVFAQLQVLSPTIRAVHFAKCWDYGAAEGYCEVNRDMPGEETIVEI